MFERAGQAAAREIGQLAVEIRTDGLEDLTFADAVLVSPELGDQSTPVEAAMDDAGVLRLKLDLREIGLYAVVQA